MTTSLFARLRALAFAPLLALVPAAADAGSFQVNPIRIEMAKGVTNAVITVRNDGEEPVVVQSSVMAWTQEDGKDVYKETQEALITPPVTTIAPGAEQILRVGLRRTTDPRNELPFRVFLQEVPPPPKPGFTGLQVALRVGIPVFVAPLAPLPRKLDWSARLGADGAILLAAQNRGTAHVQVTDFEVRLADANEPLARESMLAYVLAGQRREWTLEVPADRTKSATELRLKAFTDAGEVDIPVRLDR
jgi:fimbrial chaperone protein